MLRLWSPVIIILFVITACTADDPVTDVPFSTATSRVVGTVAAPVSIGDSAIPDDFTGGEPIVLANLGTFDVSISGDVETQFNTGTTVYNYLPDTGFLPARNQLFISGSDVSASQQLAFEFSPSIQPGEYNLVAPEDYFPGGVSASYARLGSDGTTTQFESFVDNIDGTLTLTHTGEVISGEFQFRAEYTDSSSDGELDVKVIAVIGSFENVPYQNAVDDPFELNIPLPTRNFSGGTQQP